MRAVIFAATRRVFNLPSRRVVALEAFDLAIAEKEFVAIAGPSGCGKTTCLRLAAGFDFPISGEVLIGGRKVTGPGPDRAVVVQHFALFPWKTVHDNIALGLRNAGVAAAAHGPLHHPLGRGGDLPRRPRRRHDAQPWPHRGDHRGEAAAALGLVCPALARARTPIRISYQPTNYWALPFYVATVQHWLANVGLKPGFVLFPAGAPRMASAAAGSWDVGATGSVPAVLGAARFNVLTIGIDNDESATNVLRASAKTDAAFAANPKSIAGRRILLTTNSTGDYAVRSCLAHWGIPDRSVSLVNLAQAPIVTAVISGNADLAGRWAPYSYPAMEKAGAKVLCSGVAAGVVIPGVLVARTACARAHPDLVAAYLAVYVDAWAWAKAHPKEAASMLQAADVEGGVPLTPFGLKQEFQRPTFSLDQELALMDASHGRSKPDGWMDAIGTFLKETGSVPNPPVSSSYVTDTYMKRLAAHAKLHAFADATN